VDDALVYNISELRRQKRKIANEKAEFEGKNQGEVPIFWGPESTYNNGTYVRKTNSNCFDAVQGCDRHADGRT